MNRKQIALSGTVGILIAVLGCSGGLFAAEPDFASRLPSGANAVMVIDVAKLLDSPFGKQNQLQSKLLSGYAERPLAIPATARSVAIAAVVDPIGLRSIWEVALIELTGSPRLEPMVRSQKGYLDTISGKPAAWTSHDIFYVQMDDHTLGVVRPGARQFVERWLAGKTSVGLSPALTAALAAGKSFDATFALDLSGAVGMPALNYALAMGQFPSLEKLESSHSTLIPAIASVKSMRIGFKFTDKIEAEWDIDFGQSVDGLGATAQALVVDTLQAAELYEPGIEKNFEFKAEGSKLVGHGTVEFPRFIRLVTLLAPSDMGNNTIAPPEESAGAAPPPAGATPPAASGEQAAVVASQKYYKAISKSLDNISKQAAPTQSAAWLLAQARQFQELPVLNVDPDLLAWGGMVSEAYTRAAQQLAIGQQNAKLAAEQVASPVAYSNDSWNGGGNDTADTRAAYRNAQQQRRSAAQGARTAAADQALSIFNDVMSARQKIRVAMTQKYGVEF